MNKKIRENKEGIVENIKSEKIKRKGGLGDSKKKRH